MDPFTAPMFCIVLMGPLNASHIQACINKKNTTAEHIYASIETRFGKLARMSYEFQLGLGFRFLLCIEGSS
ncbi:uncharacterized protein BKA55DRAFT_550860 [Fusarium redolens]|uniref:Uncharacterized protein n=1 Tax=Fusarium redolens TaxID=48865 RepID=A0A9P9KX54_FUSRE|nr:uncharacterized protein BKA55DRAFT_550860 [Fusarium redolens]KAH7270197.1 hypothetical protein BKA55DRAFT_550860 [Fusarium redolens]